MRKVFLLILVLISTGCQKEKITISDSVSEVFYVKNAGASMRVLVEGNTRSRVFILIVHGGPGASSFIYNTDYIRNNVEDKYTMVYWDQRNAGASQGNSNGENLNLDQMVEDLIKVILVLKSRYGQEISVFLLGHSFGSLVSTDFLIRPENQNMIRGFINVDGSHNYPLNDTLTRQMLLTVGQNQISQNRNAGYWDGIIEYCSRHTGNFNLKESQQLEDYASDAEFYMDSVKHVSILSIISEYAIKDKFPLTSMLGNYLYSENSGINEEALKTQLSSSLYRVTIPVLILWGRYDFVCPLPLGEEFYNEINSTEKRIVISPYSGHNIIFQDEKLFCDEVNTFVRKYR